MDIADIQVQENLLTRFARLVVAVGESPNAEYFFLRGLTIGRGEDNVVRILDGSVSTQHAAIERVDGTFRIRDLGSKNGVLVNGVKVSEAELKPHDRIQLGAAVLLFLRYGARPGDRSPRGAACVSESTPMETAVFAPGATEQTAAGARGAGDHIVALVSEVQLRLDALPRELDADSLAERVLACVLDVVPAERAVLLMGDERHLEVAGVRVAMEGDAASEVRVPRSVLDEVLRTRAAVMAADVALDERFANRQSVLAQGILSLLAVPVVVGPRMRGVLYLDSRIGQQIFDAETLPAMVLVGRAVGGFLAETERIGQTRRRSGAVEACDRLFARAPVEPGPPAPRRFTAAVLRVAVATASTHALEPELYLTLLSGFFERVQDAILRHGGEVENLVAPTLKAVFRCEDDGVHLDALRAALQVHRECFGSNLRARITSGVELSTRIGLEVGDLTVGLVGAPPRAYLASVGEASTRSAELVNQAARGEILLGSGAAARWASSIVSAPRPAQGAPAAGTVSVLGLADEVRAVQSAPQAALDLLPVRARALASEEVRAGVLMPAREPDRVTLQLPSTSQPPWQPQDIVCIELDLYPHDGSVTVVARVCESEPSERTVTYSLALLKPDLPRDAEVPRASANSRDGAGPP